MKTPFDTPTRENPEWTAEEMRAAKRGRDVFSPEFLEAVAEKARRGRGPQKAPTKELISIRVDPAVLADYKATGRGWQGRMRESIEHGRPRPRRKSGRKR